MAVRLRSEEEPPRKADDAEVSNCVANLIQAFTNGLNVFRRLRERKQKRKARKEKATQDPVTSEELQLSNSLRKGPHELAERYGQCYSHTGSKFAKGDAIAHASLAETLIKLNTGLVSIITSFLSHDSKSGKKHLHLDYKSLTDLSEASRREALQSMSLLYQRLSQSQLKLHPNSPSLCPRCGSAKHGDCSTRSTSASGSEKDRKRHANPRQRIYGPTITRMPIKSSSEPQLVVIRPKHTRKGNSTGSSRSSRSGSSSTSAYASPLASPLPLYITEELYEIETNGIIKGALGGPMGPAPALAGRGRRRKDSFNVHEPRPTTWPDEHPHVTTAPIPDQFTLDLPVVPKLPTFTPTPRKTAAPGSPASPRRRASPVSLPNLSPPIIKRRLDKVTPSSYTFASDSTKLGEIPQRNWTTPWDYEEAERLNAEAAVTGHSGMPVGSDERNGKKKGLFRWMRRGSAAGVAV